MPVRMWGKEMLEGEQFGVTAVQISVEMTQKARTQSTMSSRQTTLGHIPKEPYLLL